MAKEVAIPIPVGTGSAGGDNLFRRVNPFIIVVGIGMATAIAWFLSGGGTGGDGRMPTTLPEFELGDEIGGQTITGMRTRWEYELEDADGWVYEESL